MSASQEIRWEPNKVVEQIKNKLKRAGLRNSHGWLERGAQCEPGAVFFLKSQARSASAATLRPAISARKSPQGRCHRNRAACIRRSDNDASLIAERTRLSNTDASSSCGGASSSCN